MISTADMILHQEALFSIDANSTGNKQEDIVSAYILLFVYK